MKRFFKVAILALLLSSLAFMAACSESDADTLKPEILEDDGIQVETFALPMLDFEAELTNLSGGRTSRRSYYLDVPADASNLNIALSGGSGDADLYVRFGNRPTLSTYDCRPYRNGNNETCQVDDPRTGRYYILIRGYTAYSGVTLSVTYDETTAPPPPPPPPPPGGGNYDIQFVFGPNITDAQKQVFIAAANRWEQVIVGDLPTVTLNKPRNQCGQNEPAFSGTLSEVDILIYAEVAPRDGAGGVLASAGPCLIRGSSGGGLTTYGVMNFDSADVNIPNFGDVILHEMGHVFGVGTLWTRFGLTNYSQGCPSNPTYSGASARAEWQALGGTGNVPVEEDGGGGTACGHWDEETFGNLLMTGFLNSNSANPLGRMEPGTLQDMGYSVNKGAADAYSLPACSPNCLLAQPEGLDIASHEELLFPIGVVQSDGSTQLFNEDR